MAEIAEKSVGWLVLGGIILAVLAARGRYKGKYQSDVAAARAEGYAAARVELGVSQSVNVIAGNGAHDGATGDHQCADPLACPRCSDVLFRVLRAGGRGVPAAAIGAGGSFADDHEYHYDYDSRTGDNGRLDVWRRRFAGGVERLDGGSAASDRGAASDGDGAGGVAGVPCASLRPSGADFTSRPELAADMMRRPWAYDEADPRFEGSRGGRGPGR